jgi:hypothetical protein
MAQRLTQVAHIDDLAACRTFKLVFDRDITHMFAVTVAAAV